MLSLRSGIQATKMVKVIKKLISVIQSTTVISTSRKVTCKPWYAHFNFNLLEKVT